MEIRAKSAAPIPRAFLALVALVFALLLARFWRREARLSALEERYAALRAHRQDAVHHYHLAEEEGEVRAMEELRPTIVRATEALLRVQAEYVARFCTKPKVF